MFMITTNKANIANAIAVINTANKHARAFVGDKGD
jgi:hypothetical protein